MSGSSAVASCASPPHLTWSLLVNRSIAAWDDLSTDGNEQRSSTQQPRELLEECHSLDEFFCQVAPHTMFWFFHRRSAFMSQKLLKKWSRDELDDYVLLPALRGFVLRSDCLFVSHFWRTQNHPDPNGKYLRLHQGELESQTWSYVWVDWTCMPQGPRTLPEQAYFDRCLATMPGIIRNCGFTYFYPPFEPRLWILYEIAEYVLTCTGGIGRTPDIEPFLRHIDEMFETGVQATLAKHGYRCSFDRDREYLTSWLELLILLRRLHFDIDTIRSIMDKLTWFPTVQHIHLPGAVPWVITGSAPVELNKFEGTLIVNGEMYNFTPFPQWDRGKYSSGKLP